MSVLAELTLEQRIEMRQKAAQAREEEKQYVIENLRTEYVDDHVWSAMASEIGVRLPNKYRKPSLKLIRRFLRGIDKKPDWFRQIWAVKRMEDVWEMNPTLNCRAICGYTLENINDEIGE